MTALTHRRDRGCWTTPGLAWTCGQGLRAGTRTDTRTGRAGTAGQMPRASIWAGSLSWNRAGDGAPQAPSGHFAWTVSNSTIKLSI